MLPVALARTPPPRLAAPRAKPADPAGADPEVDAQRQAFDHMLRVRAELERETNAIDELGALQAKRDDQLMREWLKLI